jgi:hypothetical protein
MITSTSIADASDQEIYLEQEEPENASYQTKDSTK